MKVEGNFLVFDKPEGGEIAYRFSEITIIERDPAAGGKLQTRVNGEFVVGTFEEIVRAVVKYEIDKEKKNA
jgi:protoporphyrinogen oxidase